MLATVDILEEYLRVIAKARPPIRSKDIVPSGINRVFTVIPLNCGMRIIYSFPYDDISVRLNKLNGFADKSL